MNWFFAVNITRPLNSSILKSLLGRCHLLCGPGTVNSVSIRDGVELDRLRLPSLLHGHARKTPADGHAKPRDKKMYKSQDLASNHCRQMTAAEKRQCGVLLILSLTGGCEWCGRQTSRKCLRSFSGRRGGARLSAPSSGDRGYCNGNRGASGTLKVPQVVDGEEDRRSLAEGVQSYPCEYLPASKHTWKCVYYWCEVSALQSWCKPELHSKTKIQK